MPAWAGAGCIAFWARMSRGMPAAGDFTFSLTISSSATQLMTCQIGPCLLFNTFLCAAKQVHIYLFSRNTRSRPAHDSAPSSSRDGHCCEPDIGSQCLDVHLTTQLAHSAPWALECVLRIFWFRYSPTTMGPAGVFVKLSYQPKRWPALFRHC
jgi:hypothetical protein